MQLKETSFNGVIISLNSELKETKTKKKVMDRVRLCFTPSLRTLYDDLLAEHKAMPRRLNEIYCVWT